MTSDSITIFEERDPLGWVTVFPRILGASNLHRELAACVAWLFLRESGDGSGCLTRDEAEATILEVRPGISPKTLSRLFAKLVGSYLHPSSDGGTLYLASPGKVADRLGVEQEVRPHIVPAENLTTIVGMRRVTYSCQLPSMASTRHHAPISRARIEALTGISPDSQQRYDKAGATVFVQENHAVVAGDHGPVRRVGQGDYVGPGGEQMRRLPDTREVPHFLGSLSLAKRVNKELKRSWHRRYSEGSSSGSSGRGNAPSESRQSPGRSYCYGASREEAIKSLTRTCQRCRDRDRPTCRHVAGILAYPKRGQVVYELIERGSLSVTTVDTFAVDISGSNSGSTASALSKETSNNSLDSSMIDLSLIEPADGRDRGGAAPPPTTTTSKALVKGDA